MTLILQSDTISNPIFPNVNALDPTLLVSIGAAQFAGYAQGDDVTAIVAGGYGEASLRTYEGKVAAWSFPTYDNSRGRPSIRGTGTQHIRNDTGTGTAGKVIATPTTFFVTYRLDTGNVGTAARLLSAGITTATNIGVRPSGTGDALVVSTPNQSHTLNGGLARETWGTLGVVFDGANSAVILPKGEVVPVVLDDIPLGGQRFLGSYNPVAAGGMAGNISAVRFYSRAIGVDELTAIQSAMNNA